MYLWNWQKNPSLTAAAAVATALALLGTGCSCRRDAAPPSGPRSDQAQPARDPGAAPAKTAAVALPHPATTTTQGLLAPNDLPVAGTATAAIQPYEPGAEGTLLGLADADGYLQRLRATLAAEKDSQGAGKGLTLPGELALRRVWAGAELADVLVATAQRVTLTTAGLAGRVWRDSSGCTAIYHESGGAAGQSSVCPAEADDALSLAAGWVALGREDLLPGLQIEAFQAADDVTLRLALPAWHLRWLVRLDRRGTLRGIDLPARQLTMRWGQDPDGRPMALVHRKGQLVWRWQVGPSTGQARYWQVGPPGGPQPLTSWEAVGPLGTAMQQALDAAQVPRVGAMTLELRRLPDGYCVVGLGAPVLTAATTALPAGVQWATSRGSGAVLAQGGPAKVSPAELLAKRTDPCLLVTVAVPHAGLRSTDGAQLILQACQGAEPRLR